MNCNVQLIDMWIHRKPLYQIARQIILSKRLFAVIKAYSWCIQESIALGTILRKNNVITIAVGQHVNHADVVSNDNESFKNDWSMAFDYSIIGDPESECPQLIEQLLLRNDNSQLDRYRHFQQKHQQPDKNLPYPQFSSKMMNDYAFPFPVSQLNHKKWVYIQTSWGCPHRCLHCSNAVRKSYGKLLFKRDSSDVVNEIKFHIKKGAQAICFEDDALFTDKTHIRLLLQHMQQQNIVIPWMAHARPDELNEPILESASKSGLKLLKIGVESGAEKQIEIIGKAANGAQWIAQVKRVFQLLNKYNIASIAMFMIGTPDETEEDIYQSISLAKELAPDYIQVQCFTPYPDTIFYQTLPPKSREMINTMQCYHYSNNHWSAAKISEKQILRYQYIFYRSFYGRAEYIINFFKNNKAFLNRRSILIDYIKSLVNMKRWRNI